METYFILSRLALYVNVNVIGKADMRDIMNILKRLGEFFETTLKGLLTVPDFVAIIRTESGGCKMWKRASVGKRG